MIDESKENFAQLNEEQKALINSAFADGACPDLSDLTKKVFNNNSLDGRSKEGRLIKEYISEFKIGNIKVRVQQKPNPVELSEEQKKLILDNYKKRDFSILNFVKSIFNNDSITPFFPEYKVVSNFINDHEIKNSKHSYENNNDELEVKKYNPETTDRTKNEIYRAPVNMAQTIARINKYLNYDWKEDILKKSQLKQVESLQSYLRVFRFQYQINSYSRMEDRELFEDAFIRYTHDKEDLTQEELDQFITLSNEVVIAADIQRRIEYLRLSLDDMASDSEGKKISMGLNEAINNAQTEYNQCIARQDKLYKSLTVNRSKRIEEKRNENASILNLVYAWKQEENRARMIALAEKQREALQIEVDKMTSMDEFKAIIRGLDPKEILNT
jgi:hypothetical protein